MCMTPVTSGINSIGGLWGDKNLGSNLVGPLAGMFPTTAVGATLGSEEVVRQANRLTPEITLPGGPQPTQQVETRAARQGSALLN